MVILEFANQDRNGRHNTRLIISQDAVATRDDSDRLLSRYNLATETLTVVDHANETYTAIDKAAARAISTQLKNHISDLLAKVEALPPEQRESATASLQQMLGGNSQGSTSPTEFTKQNETGQFAGVSCRWYQYVRDPAVPGRACMVEPQSLAGGEALLRMLHSLSDIYRILLSNQHATLQVQIPNNPMAPLAALDKLPIRISEPANAEQRGLEIELLSVTTADFQESLLTIPDSYSLKTLVPAPP